MSDTPDYRVTIRLSPELATQLQARGSHGQPLAAIVRQTLVEYLARQPDTPAQAVELATAMAARLDGFQDQVEQLAARVETLTASRLPQAATTAELPQARTTRGQRKLTPRQIRALRDKRRR